MNDLKIYFNKVMLCNMKDLQWIPLFPLFLWMYRRLSLDCFDSEDIFNTPWFSGSFYSYKFLKGLIDVYSHLWWTEMHGSWAQLWRSQRSLSRLGLVPVSSLQTGTVTAGKAALVTGSKINKVGVQVSRQFHMPHTFSVRPAIKKLCFKTCMPDAFSSLGIQDFDAKCGNQALKLLTASVTVCHAHRLNSSWRASSLLHPRMARGEGE